MQAGQFPAGRADDWGGKPVSGGEMWAKSPAGGDSASSTASIDADYYRRLLDRLTSMLSHDLRTPLSAMSGWLFLLDSDKLDAAGRKRALDKIRSNLDEEVRLLDDSLALARVKAGTLKIERTLLDLRTAIDAAIGKMKVAAAAKGVIVEFAPAAELSLQVEADEPRLRRAFELVIERAIRDLQSGTPKLSIEAFERSTSIEIVVTDSGRGIAPGGLRWITDPFGSPPDADTGSRHSPDRNLLVAAALIEVHGGRLSVSSEGEGAGTSVAITLARGS